MAIKKKNSSKNRYKVKQKLQRVYQKLKTARKYYLHSIINELIKENDIITVENLKINEMIKKGNISKRIYDAAWNELIRMLKYKSKWLGKK